MAEMFCGGHVLKQTRQPHNYPLTTRCVFICILSLEIQNTFISQVCQAVNHDCVISSLSRGAWQSLPREMKLNYLLTRDGYLQMMKTTEMAKHFMCQGDPKEPRNTTECVQN